MEDHLLEVGCVDRAHGIRGDVVVSLVTNRLERLAPGSVLRAGERALTVLASRPHQGRHIVSFEGVNSRDEAEALHGAPLSAPALGAGAGDFFVHDLIGAELHDVAGARHGVVTSVEANPASDLLVVDDRWYVPLRFVIEQRPGAVVVDVPEGLFD